MSSTLIVINTVAFKLRLTPQQVRNLCWEDKLKAERFGRSWVVEAAAVEEYYDSNTCGHAADQVNDWSGNSPVERRGPIALSFFSGAMGLAVGLEKAGIKCIALNERDKWACQTLRKNNSN
ncbi:MAG: DNA cytosine methyltransferase [Saprospiraceae bacterium]|jgi:DNA (cytosine-5)-methyltransferase 1|nr:DNA cytosine methyltransferase [Saprospiraceae bacterium]